MMSFEKEITVDGIEYSIKKVSAIAYDDLADKLRQDALLVRYTNNYGEIIESVVFGFEMPDDEADLRDMFDESSAWEFDREVLESVEI